MKACRDSQQSAHGALNETWRGGQEAASLLSPSTFTTDKASTMASHNTHKQRTARKFGAVALAGVLVLAGCAPAGRDEACDVIRAFSRSAGFVQNYGQLEVLASRLSDDLYGIALRAGDQELRNDIRHVAGAARDLATVIRGGWGPSTVGGEISILVSNIDAFRGYWYC